MYESFWAAATLLGDPVLWSFAVLLLLGAFFLIERGYVKTGDAGKRCRLIKKFLLLMIPAMAASILAPELLKLIFQVPRPCITCPGIGCNPYCPPTFSFPSGHTSTITGAVTALVLLLRKRRYLALYALPVVVGASRIALDVHTAADIIGGFFVGLALTLLVWRFRKSIYRWEEEALS
jgi:membrane-associated phospholipid phosphatase